MSLLERQYLALLRRISPVASCRAFELGYLSKIQLYSYKLLSKSTNDKRRKTIYNIFTYKHIYK